ncbi:MAG TPA: LLM class flavin-dependent oxidoreductase [Solirubrobacteraceae bacterium]|nr:LLM class flavin-dependent oxidoreductase [Solirubrobacteraceae bacterium]
MRPLRVGIQLPEVERVVRWPEYAAMARAAEEVGFDSVWVGDHLLYRDDGRPERGPWDAWTLLTGLAMVTERVGIGPLVACTAFHRPGLLARIAAAVDELSGGRLVVGLGAGWNEPEFTAFGIPFDDRIARFTEAFEITRRLLAGERVTFRGAYEQVTDAVLLPPPARRPPLMIGALRRQMLDVAIPHVDAWNTWYEWYGNTPDGFAHITRRVDEAARRAGRAPEAIARSACVLVVLDPAAGERRLVEKAPPVEGSPEAVSTFLRDLAAAGADEAILVASPINESSIRALGRALAVLDD